MAERIRAARKVLRLFWIPLMVLVLIAGACGGNGDDSSATTDPDTTPSTNETTSTSSSSTTRSSTTTTTTTTPEPQDSEVLVFFSDDDPDECGAVVGFIRSVPDGADPIRFAFDELVKGPRSSETDDGAFSFFSSATAGSVRSATTDGDVLVVDFDDFRDVLGPTGANTSCGIAAMLGQLNATAFQFDEVDTVRYELEGSCDEFGFFLQSDCIEVDRPDWEAAVAGQLPGEPVDGIIPPGAVLGVVGVEADDVLNVRALPGSRQTIVDTLSPLTKGLVFSGRERLVGSPPSVWYEIDTGSAVGWVNSRFVAPLGGTVDVTSEVVAALGEIPSSETGTQVAEMVIEARTDPLDGDQRVVLVDGPHQGDLNEITYDILGFLDDSVQGERLHFFIVPPDVDDGPMTLKSVEATFICARGDGLGELCP